MKLEPRPVRLITTITEYQCDNCKEGSMVRDKGCNTIQLTDPPKFKHICTQCGKGGWLSDSYPLANNSYNPSDTVSESDAERIRQLEQTVLNMGKQIERLSQDVQSAKSGWL
ncbi:hypothetical protein [Providencia rettgeri]|uniref:hypothetical protein n=1 Tax=Providencia rettgeri TaxID=587 RepID=UPI0018C5B999|nr:hypothetical protein [Providencia rettgeri]MBG5927560.1 hypothetical protein [Providencia rettgeri]